MAIDTIKATAILDGAVDTADLADGAVTAAKITDGEVTDAKIASGINSSKLTGALPAIDGSSLTGVDPADGSITTAKLDSTLDLSGKTVTYGLTDSDMPAGASLQTVHTNSTSQFNLNFASGGVMTSWTATGFTISITPSSSSSKILLFGSIPWLGIANGDTTGEIQLQFYRSIGGGSYSSIGQNQSGSYIANNTYVVGNMLEEDSPSTTSAVTYQIYARGRYLSAGQYSLNRGSNVHLKLTAMEIAG